MWEARASTGAPAAVGVVEALDEVGVAGAARARAHREPPGDLRLGRRREGRGLLVVDVHPLDPRRAAEGVDHRVEAVADEPVDAGDARLPQYLDDLVGDGGAHRTHHKVTEIGIALVCRSV